MDGRTECWRLTALVAEAQQGHLAAPPDSDPSPWNAGDIEALWDNLLNDWPLGPVVLVDVSAGPRRGWHGWFGPHRLYAQGQRRLLVVEGAARLEALAWSLADPSLLLRHRGDPRTPGLWLDRCLVLDVDQRRARFVDTDYCPDRHLPVRLLPDAAPCLKAIQGMTLWSIEREWLNQAARRLLDSRCTVHLFPDHAGGEAERMLANYRRINGLTRTPVPPPPPPLYGAVGPARAGAGR